MAERALFVSPHLDDAVLSAAGTMLALRADGVELVVATLFTAGDDEAWYARRRDEDCAALAVLGAEVLHCGLADAPSRRGHPSDFRPLVLEPRARDAADLAAVLAALRPLAANFADVWFPLGVGGHVDHRLAFDAARALAGPRVHFYEERPYAQVRGAVAVRLRELDAYVLHDPDPCTPAQYRAALEGAPFLRAYLPAGPDRAACLDELVARFAAARVSVSPRLTLVPLTQRFDDAACACALRAIGCYRSQLAALFDGAPPLDPASYAERSWTRGR